MAREALDLTGQKFGLLIVIEQAGKDEWGKITWRCRCQCGNERIAPGNALKRGRVRSCGCKRELHGMTGSRLYDEWRDMKSRCANPRDKRFKDYGGRGITVCAEWANSFEAFRDWALANGYRDDLTLDREDNDGNYCPENCRWATKKEQQNNRRCNHMLTYRGKTQTMAQWADETGISYRALQKRLKYGWSTERALTTPTRKRRT